MTRQAVDPGSDPRHLQQALWRWDNEGGAGPATLGYPSIMPRRTENYNSDAFILDDVPGEHRRANTLAKLMPAFA
jgi:hypothetical protein